MADEGFNERHRTAVVASSGPTLTDLKAAPAQVP